MTGRLAAGETQARGGKWYATNTRLPDGRVRDRRLHGRANVDVRHELA